MKEILRKEMAALSAPAVQEEQQPVRRLRYQLAAAVRSINWSYAIFWSISSTQPGVLVWTDGFYNGEVKTRKISNTTELTAEQLVMQRSAQLRDLYEALQSGECDRGAARPDTSLSPEDLGDTEWYYMVSMTYAFRPSQGLPGRSFASNEHVWMCNAHLAGSKAFPRALVAKTASIKTIVCIPLMGGVLELGTTDTVAQDPGLVSRASAAFWQLPYPTCSQEPSFNLSPKEAADIIVFEDLADHSAMERTLSAEGQEQEPGEDESLSNASLDRIMKEIDEFYGLIEEMGVHTLEDSLAMDGSFKVPSSPLQQTPGVATNDANTSSAPVDGSRATSFTAWMRSESDSDEVAVPIIEEPHKLLKNVVAGGAWANNGGGGGTTTRATEESGIKNHVMSERKRREKLNEMFLILKSMVPFIHKKVDKASILAETITYVKELQRRVQELESSREFISSPSETTRLPRRDDNEVARKKVSTGSKRKGSELGHDVERQHPWTLPKDSASNVVTVTVSDKEVLLEVQCRWQELLMTRVFDAIKSLHLDVVSVQASAPNGFMGLKVRAQFAGSTAVVPWTISEALRKAIIGKR